MLATRCWARVTSLQVGDELDLHTCAEIIEKLHFIASQLPAKQFADPSARIDAKLKEIESRLLVKFSEATGDTVEMRAYARYSWLGLDFDRFSRASELKF